MPGISSVVGAVLQPLLSFIVKVGSYVGVYFFGKSAARKEQVEDVAKTLGEFADIEAEAPKTRAEILEDMRKGGL